MDFIEVSAKTVNDAILDACEKLIVSRENLEYEVINEGTSGFLGFNSKKAIIRAKAKEEENNISVIDLANTFLKDIFQAMKLVVSIDISYDEENSIMDINLVGDNMGILIGKRGQTLDSLQYLTSLIVNKGLDTYIRIKVDTENYRNKRKETLEILANKIGMKVKKNRTKVSLEPMNPYERRIIHSALQGNKFVTTYSEGNEPFRKVIVTLRK